MSPKIKNIIIIMVAAGILIFVYFYFFNKKDSAALVPSAGGVLPVTSGVPSEASSVGKDFLVTLLNIKNIKIEDSIFSDETFNSLHDSSIELDLTQNKNDEGRSNPFAPIGSDILVSAVTSLDIQNTNQNIKINNTFDQIIQNEDVLKTDLGSDVTPKSSSNSAKIN